jgi:hypothetical protein
VKVGTYVSLDNVGPVIVTYSDDKIIRVALRDASTRTYSGHEFKSLVWQG